MAYDGSDSKVLHKRIHHVEAQPMGTLLAGLLIPFTLNRIAEMLSSEVRTIFRVLVRVAFGS